MRAGVIPHVLPLLFAYDATAEQADPQDATESTAAVADAAAAAGGPAAAEERGPKFLGLGIVRSNMQASVKSSDECDFEIAGDDSSSDGYRSWTSASCGPTCR